MDLRAMLISWPRLRRSLPGTTIGIPMTAEQVHAESSDVARGTDLTRMRDKLSEAVEELKSAQDEMRRDNTGLLAGMHEQLMTFQKRLERTEGRAFEDRVTGLLNRGEGEARLTDRLKQELPVSVILVDLDDFKHVNDRFGHASGDQVLRTVAHILTNELRSCDTVCRWGGDEFLVMLAGDRAMAEQQAARLRVQLARPMQAGDSPRVARHRHQRFPGCGTSARQGESDGGPGDARR
jgi:diguanylate cyclase (GGDEF)-like protein